MSWYNYSSHGHNFPRLYLSPILTNDASLSHLQGLYLGTRRGLDDTAEQSREDKMIIINKTRCWRYGATSMELCQNLTSLSGILKIFWIFLSFKARRYYDKIGRGLLRDKRFSIMHVSPFERARLYQDKPGTVLGQLSDPGNCQHRLT